MGERLVASARSLRASHIVAVIVLALIILVSITGFVWAQKGITVVIDGESRYIRTQAATVGDLLNQVDVEIGPGDVVTPAFGGEVTDGMTVVVRHAVPVTISTSVGDIEIDVIGLTVADALVAAGVDPGTGIQCDPPMDTPLTEAMDIQVRDVFVRVTEEPEEVPFETITMSDPDLPQGARHVVTKGESGSELHVYRVVVTDGVEGQRTLISEVVTEEPVDEIIAMGTKRSGQTMVSRSRPPAKAKPTSGEKLTVTTTAYAPNVDGVGTRTATGDRAGYGIIAVDPRVIPLGTRLYIPGYGYGVASDTGGAIKGNKIDLCFNTRAECIAWGRRTVTITILD